MNYNVSKFIGLNLENKSYDNESDLLELLKLENKYNINSFTNFVNPLNNDDGKRWKMLIEKFLNNNGNYNLINTKYKVNIFAILNDDSKSSFKFCTNFNNYFKQNSIICIPNNHEFIDKIIKFANHNNIILFLVSNEERQKKDKSYNVLTIYNENPVSYTLKICDYIYMNNNEMFTNVNKFNFLNNNFKHKIYKI